MKIVEIKVLKWLNEEQIGLCSITMCATLFENFKSHYKIVDKLDTNGNVLINWPNDNSDFKRCLKFIEIVPEVKERLVELKHLSPEWSNLVENWNKITSLLNEDQFVEAYALIKLSITKPKPRIIQKNNFLFFSYNK